MEKTKFLVLKSNIIENEQNLIQQFFRRRRYRVLVEQIIEYTSVIEKLQLVKLNKNFFSIVKEKKYLEILPRMVSDLKDYMKYIIRYCQHDLTKFVEMSMSYLSSSQDSLIITPIYFYKSYYEILPNVNNNKSVGIYRKKIGDIGAECLAYYLHKYTAEKICFNRCDNIDNFFTTYYLNTLDSLKSIQIDRIPINWNLNVLTNIFNLQNLKSFFIINTKILSSETIINICTAITNGFSRLENLSFEKCFILDQYMKPITDLIKNYPWIKKLNLGFNRLNEENLLLLALNMSGSNLTYLNIRNNRIESTYLRKFFLNLIKSRPKELKCLILYDNYVKSRAMQMLSKYISRKDCSLSELKIYVKCKTEDIEYFLNKIKSTSKLKYLDLACNRYRVFNNIEQRIKKINQDLNLNIEYGRSQGEYKFEY